MARIEMAACVLIGLLAAAVLPAAAQSPPSTAGQQLRPSREAEFQRLEAQILERRTVAAGETASFEESALKILDAFTLETLNAPGAPGLDALNRRLTALCAQPRPPGQGYFVASLGGSPAVYGLTVNFGSSGPSALRIYARAAQNYILAAQIDSVALPDYFDDFLVVLPIASKGSSRGVLFVTITGRTDEFATGAFAAWRLVGTNLKEIWSTNLLSHSSYESLSDGIRVAFCAEADEEQPGDCHRMARETYSWDGASWKRVERADLGPPKP